MRFAVAVTFPAPIEGYWNRGTRSGGLFKLDLPYPEHPGPGHYLRYGDFSLNFWFTAGSGRSWRESAANAKKRLLHWVPPGTTVELVEDTRRSNAWEGLA